MKFLLYLALSIGIFTYMFWHNLPKGSFYIGNAIFIFLLSAYIFYSERNSFIKFIIFGLAFSNLIDELYFDPTIIGINELVLLFVLPIIWFLKLKK